MKNNIKSVSTKFSDGREIKIETGIRNKGSVEVISGLNEGDIIVAEGLKKINPKGKIKPINK